MINDNIAAVVDKMKQLRNAIRKRRHAYAGNCRRNELWNL
jgi:hypothetical protein